MKVNVEIEFTTSVLAGSPADPDIFTRFLASQAPTPELGQTEVTDIAVKEEGMSKVEAGVSIFAKEHPGEVDSLPHIYDYHVKGFFKSAAEALTGKDLLSAYKSKINKFVFVFPRKLFFYRNGEIVTKPEGDRQRVVRAMTAQGPRTTPKKSECMYEGVSIKFSIEVLPPLGEKEIDVEMIKQWLSYGKYGGISEWVTGSNGRFKVLTFDVVEEPLSARKPREVKEPKPKKEIKEIKEPKEPKS